MDQLAQEVADNGYRKTALKFGCTKSTLFKYVRLTGAKPAKPIDRIDIKSILRDVALYGYKAIAKREGVSSSGLFTRVHAAGGIPADIVAAARPAKMAAKRVKTRATLGLKAAPLDAMDADVLLHEVTQDGYRKVAERLGVTKTAVFDRVKQLGGLPIGRRRVQGRHSRHSRHRGTGLYNEAGRIAKRIATGLAVASKAPTRARECECGNPIMKGHRMCARCFVLDNTSNRWTKPHCGHGVGTYQEEYRLRAGTMQFGAE